MGADTAKLTAEALEALDTYYDAIDGFYDKHIPGACYIAAAQVTDARLKQVEADLSAIVERMNGSPSFGLFLVDVALSLLPVFGAHILEASIKASASSTLRNAVMQERSWQRAKAEMMTTSVEGMQGLRRMAAKRATGAAVLELSAVESVSKRFDRSYREMFRDVSAIEAGRTDLKRQLRLVEQQFSGPLPDVTHPWFEFATPVVNDSFQAQGDKLLAASESDDLALFGPATTEVPIPTFYKQLTGGRFKGSPNGLLEFMVGDISRRQLEINKAAKALAKFFIRLLPSERFLKSEISLYRGLYMTLPRGNELSRFVVTMTELFETVAWIMYLGDPKDWFSTTKPDGSYYAVPRSGGASLGGTIRQAEFFLQRNIPPEIAQHLLETFHPDPNRPEMQSYADYYRTLKKGVVRAPPQQEDVDSPQSYRYLPRRPDAPPEDIRSTSYTAEETALANLQQYFVRMYAGMKSSEGVFANIMNIHKLV